MSRSAQIEMIGLVIVVILLVIGLLFYFKFGILRKEMTAGDPTRDLVYATNLMGALLNIEVCEQEYKLDEVLVRCFEDSQGYSTGVFCNDLGSCDYAKEEIEKIMADLELKSYQKYSISIKEGSESFVLKEDCETGILASTVVITPEQEHYTVDFRIC